MGSFSLGQPYPLSVSDVRPGRRCAAVMTQRARYASRPVSIRTRRDVTRRHRPRTLFRLGICDRMMFDVGRGGGVDATRFGRQSDKCSANQRPPCVGRRSHLNVVPQLSCSRFPASSYPPPVAPSCCMSGGGSRSMVGQRNEKSPIGAEHFAEDTDERVTEQRCTRGKK